MVVHETRDADTNIHPRAKTNIRTNSQRDERSERNERMELNVYPSPSMQNERDRGDSDTNSWNSKCFQKDSSSTPMPPDTEEKEEYEKKCN